LKLVATLNLLSEIETLIHLGVSVLLLDSDILTTRTTHPQTKEFIEQAINIVHTLGKEVYINLNTMLHESDIPVAKEYLLFLKRVKVDGIVIFDWTYYPLAKVLNIHPLIIYRPGTLTTNLYDPRFYEQLGIKGMTVAREITLESIVAITEIPQKIELSMVGHGYMPMFYSKRPLITSYLREKNIDIIDHLGNPKLSIRESNRQTISYPIYEDAFGTHIMREKKLESFNEVLVLRPFLSDFFIERFLISDNEYYDAIRAYNDERLIPNFRTHYQKEYDSGFFYKQTNLRNEVKL